jgi:hypothetical protein
MTIVSKHSLSWLENLKSQLQQVQNNLTQFSCLDLSVIDGDWIGPSHNFEQQQDHAL